MIWNILIIIIVVIVLIVIARRLPDARKAMAEAHQASSKDLSLYGLIAQADDAFDVKQYQKAENLYIKAAASDPQNAKIYSRLGAIYLEQKNYYDARDAFLQAVRLEPDLASRHVNLGLAYLGLKDYYKSSESFKKALELDPKNKKYQHLFERTEKAQEKEKKKGK